MSLLRDIQSAAIDSSTDLASLLRKCKVLASRLGNPEFKQWIEYELSGYPDKESLPDYRILSVNSKGYFSGPFGSGLNNADIPLLCLPEELREMMGHTYLSQPVAAMQALLSKGSSSLQEPWNPDIVAMVGAKIYRGMNCLSAWKVIPAGGIVAAVDTIRTRVLNFVLDIEAENPLAGEAAQNSNPVPQEKVQHIFNMHIHGTVQNLAPGSSNFQQTANYAGGPSAEIFAQMLDAIRAAQLPRDTTAVATQAVSEMQAAHGTNGFKTSYLKFTSVLADHLQILGPVVAPFLAPLAAMG